MGALLGLASSSQGSLKRKSRAALAAALILSLAGSTVFWPWINLSQYAQAEVERAGVEALQRGHDEYAKTLLEKSARMKGAPARTWYNLGIAYHRLGRYEDALSAYEQAATMPDSTSEFRETARQMKEYWMRRRGKQ
jgi:cytochrome c-type biogenesis protein CcmH/NrfG